MSHDTPIIATRGLCKVYGKGDVQVHALRDVDLTIDEGQFVAVMGPSGSGKSTLMNIIGCLDRPTSGTYMLNGQEVTTMSPNELAEVRNRTIGFVFQNFSLLSRTSALDNAMLPLLYAGVSGAAARRRAAAALERVGLADRMRHLPSELSGGQQQRVAIARAIVNQPRMILADEPTGNLDSHTSAELMELFQHLDCEGITIVMVTHELDIAAYASRALTVMDGRIVQDDLQIPRRSPGEMAS
jgi:putative ABC transport system ATP-binding protein